MNFGDTSDGADAEAGEILAYDSLTCKQLQERLVDLGLKKSGKKSELVARLMAADLKDKELAAAGTVGDEEVEADEDVADEVEVEAAVDDIEDELVGRIDWSNLTDSELRRLCELWHVKGPSRGCGRSGSWRRCTSGARGACARCSGRQTRASARVGS